LKRIHSFVKIVVETDSVYQSKDRDREEVSIRSSAVDGLRLDVPGIASLL